MQLGEVILDVIVTVLEETDVTAELPRKHRSLPAELAEAMLLLGDDNILMEPVIAEDEWSILK